MEKDEATITLDSCLPAEILAQIFCNLSLKALKSYITVSKRWHEILHSKIFWTLLAKQQFPIIYSKSQKEYISKNEFELIYYDILSWKYLTQIRTTPAKSIVSGIRNNVYPNLMSTIHCNYYASKASGASKRMGVPDQKFAGVVYYGSSLAMTGFLKKRRAVANTTAATTATVAASGVQALEREEQDKSMYELMFFSGFQSCIPNSETVICISAQTESFQQRKECVYLLTHVGQLYCFYLEPFLFQQSKAELCFEKLVKFTISKTTTGTNVKLLSLSHSQLLCCFEEMVLMIQFSKKHAPTVKVLAPFTSGAWRIKSPSITASGSNHLFFINDANQQVLQILNTKSEKIEVDNKSFAKTKLFQKDRVGKIIHIYNLNSNPLVIARILIEEKTKLYKLDLVYKRQLADEKMSTLHKQHQVSDGALNAQSLSRMKFKQSFFRYIYLPEYHLFAILYNKKSGTYCSIFSFKKLSQLKQLVHDEDVDFEHLSTIAIDEVPKDIALDDCKLVVALEEQVRIYNIRSGELTNVHKTAAALAGIISISSDIIVLETDDDKVLALYCENLASPNVPEIKLEWQEVTVAKE